MDKNSKSFFKENMIFLDLEFNNRIEFLNFIGSELYKKGYVKASFTESLITREAKYPTGLPSVPYAVAIPHCEPQHVITNTISIIRFKNPVKFLEMGTLDKEIFVKFAFVLTLDGKQQVVILKDLMSLFMNSEFMQNMSLASVDEVKELIRQI
jgi:galactitol PTS system EIIA component